MNRMIRALFDRGHTFLVNRVMTLNGKALAVDQIFNKTEVTTRRLRQLYDARWLKIAPESIPTDIAATESPNAIASMPPLPLQPTTTESESEPMGVNPPPVSSGRVRLRRRVPSPE